MDLALRLAITILVVVAFLVIVRDTYRDRLPLGFALFLGFLLLWVGGAAWVFATS